MYIWIFVYMYVYLHICVYANSIYIYRTQTLHFLSAKPVGFRKPSGFANIATLILSDYSKWHGLLLKLLSSEMRWVKSSWDPLSWCFSGTALLPNLKKSKNIIKSQIFPSSLHGPFLRPEGCMETFIGILREVWLVRNAIRSFGYWARPLPSRGATRLMISSGPATV